MGSRATDTRTSAGIQSAVIGALILRELHTRFGRENIGYLWLFAEPLLLAVAVGALHSQQHLPLSGGVRSIPFAFAGYALFIMFRSTVSRAETLLEANRPLLNHRRVTIFDMLAARAVLEVCSTVLVLALLLFAAWIGGFADLPADPLLVVAAVGLMGWFSFACSMIVTALAHESPVSGRLIHPLLYLSMPLSGAFFAMVWLPESFRAVLQWVPTVPIFELLRTGLFEGYDDSWAGLAYPVAVCGFLTLIGLAGLRMLRPRLELT
ncbi:ABC transporter permease [Novosphingobium aquiterrae]|uniref:ABC transporter permease n=1 Tax=Novosphingobium aquiterrae TaxID=624388 RepID=A0ABV6PJ77_9SPHN